MLRVAPWARSTLSASAYDLFDAGNTRLRRQPHCRPDSRTRTRGVANRNMVKIAHPCVACWRARRLSSVSGRTLPVESADTHAHNAWVCSSAFFLLRLSLRVVNCKPVFHYLSSGGLVSLFGPEELVCWSTSGLLAQGQS